MQPGKLPLFQNVGTGPQHFIHQIPEQQSSHITLQHENKNNLLFTLDKSTSSAVQKDASAFLYICHMS
jgi:hypothetical protein